MIHYRAQLDLAEAAGRVRRFNNGGTPLSPWAVLGVSDGASAGEITAAYTRLCDAESKRLNSAEMPR